MSNSMERFDERWVEDPFQFGKPARFSEKKKAKETAEGIVKLTAKLSGQRCYEIRLVEGSYQIWMWERR